MHWDGNNLRGYYTFTQLQFMCKKTNVQIPDILYQYINQQQITHDDLKGKKIMDSKLTHNQNQTFHSELFGDLTTLTHEDGTIWFIAKEVAEKLGYSNPHEAIRTHCKGVSEFRTPTKGGEQLIKIIPERDVYRLVMKSKLPTAEKFENWVVDEVLPTIRKTGSYGQQQQVKLPNMKELAIMLIQSEEEKEKLQLELKEKQPLINFAETVAKADNAILVNHLAHLAQNDYNIKIGETRLWRLLREWEYIQKHNTLPTQKAQDLGFFFVKETLVTTNHGSIMRPTTKVTPKGVIFLINKLKEHFSNGKSNILPDTKKSTQSRNNKSAD